MQSEDLAAWSRSLLSGAARAGIILGLALGACMAQSSGGDNSAAKVAVVDGSLGPCSAEFKVTDTAGKPAQDAKISVRIAYGFMSLHKLDLEVTTNSEGKARFEGLPSTVKRPLEFRAVQGKLEGVAVDDPAKTCKAQHDLVLHQATAPQT
jgi:hypothetical protein